MPGTSGLLGAHEKQGIPCHSTAGSPGSLAHKHTPDLLALAKRAGSRQLRQQVLEQTALRESCIPTKMTVAPQTRFFWPAPVPRAGWGAEEGCWGTRLLPRAARPRAPLFACAPSPGLEAGGSVVSEVASCGSFCLHHDKERTALVMGLGGGQAGGWLPGRMRQQHPPC